MAFISGYDTIFKCPECGEQVHCTIKDKDELIIVYKHSIDGQVMINGYPSPCGNNGKKLKINEVDKFKIPIIHTAGPGYY